MLTYKRKLILNKAQQSRIEKWIGTCRFIYNMCLEIKISSWRNKQKSIGESELSRQLTEIRDIDWIGDVPRNSLTAVLNQLEASYSTFFKGGGFPKWANKRKYNSITFKQNGGSIKVEENKIYIPKIGWVKMFKDCRITGNIKRAIIKKDPTGYFVSITTDATKNIQNKDENQVVGLDMGVKHFCVDSNGKFIANPKHFKKYERQLRIENRSLSRKKKGGKNWLKQAKRLALLHHTIGNVRRDFLHKESTLIAKENHTVILEDLNIKGMVRSKLSKHILDAGWGMFRVMLEYKTNVVAINPKFTSQTCNDCGAKDAKSRISQSKFMCTSCGVESNADENAAKNILSKGIAHIRQRGTLVRA
jgi:putative transposase